MPKQPTENQHDILHQLWPSNCCLCKEKVENTLLRERIDYLEKLVHSLTLQIQDNIERELDLDRLQRQSD